LSVPLDVASYLTPDENVLKTGRSGEWDVYVTNKRIILRKGVMLGKEIVEASYRHISSIEYKKESPLGYIIAGIILIALAFFLGIKIHSWLYIVGLIGVIIIIASFLIKPVFKIHIVGRKPITLSGRLEEELIKIIREYREKVECVSS